MIKPKGTKFFKNLLWEPKMSNHEVDTVIQKNRSYVTIKFTQNFRCP